MIKETVISAIIFMIRYDNGGVLVYVLANAEFKQKSRRSRKNVTRHLFFQFDDCLIHITLCNLTFNIPFSNVRIRLNDIIAYQ